MADRQEALYKSRCGKSFRLDVTKGYDRIKDRSQHGYAGDEGDVCRHRWLAEPRNRESFDGDSDRSQAEDRGEADQGPEGRRTAAEAGAAGGDPAQAGERP